MKPSVRMRRTAVAVVGLAIVTLLLPNAGVAGSAATDGRARVALFDPKPSPDDAEFYNDQWNLKAIRAKAGWPAEPAQPSTLVAVVDTGIDYLHPDLAGRVRLDLSKSYLGEDSPTSCDAGDPGMPYRVPGAIDEDAVARADDPDNPPVMDFHSHGTAVSGLIVSNAQYLAGVTQRTQLFAVKVHGVSRRNCLSVYLEGIKYAVQQGADVIHLSINLEFREADFPAAVASINTTLKEAHDSGAILVAAAGNAQPGRPPADVGQGPTFRFCKPAVVFCVSATGPASADQVEEPYWDEIAAYSNFGSPIDVAGPGGTGPALTPTVGVRLACARTILPTPMPKPSDACGGDTVTWESTGTSFGAAATSGLAALLVSIMGKEQPPDVIESVIEQSAVDRGDPGKDAFYGHGRIDVRNAMAMVLP